MRILRSTIAIIIEIVILILSILWFQHTKDFEPLIAILTAFVALIYSTIRNFGIRPKLALHKNKNFWGRSPIGYTENNPRIINVGIDNPEMYWELNWNYKLEIRNNSSATAYYVEIDYQNLPPKTFIKGEIGKIEPITSHEKRVFEIKLTQTITGSHFEADKYLVDNADILTEKLVIKLKYKDESGMSFCTKYNWVTDSNTFR